jgi:hypothetical protein
MKQNDKNTAKPAIKKDKQIVIDEVWTEDRIRGFLDLESVAGLDVDFHQLLRAYQSMKLEDFEKFVGFFIAANKNVNAKNTGGETALSIISQHRHGKPYADILIKSGST